MATKERVRGMNAALNSGEAGVGEMRPARTPMRPRQLLVAVVVVAVGAGAVVTTYRAMADPAPAITGQVTPAHEYFLNFGGDGTLSTLTVKPGQQVKAGQVLATEDTTVSESDLKAAQALVQADTTVLETAQNPQASTAQENQATVAAARAQNAVNSAQSALTLAQNRGKSNTDLQTAVVANRQKALDADTSRYAASCVQPAGASTGTSTGTSTNTKAIANGVGADSAVAPTVSQSSASSVPTPTTSAPSTSAPSTPPSTVPPTTTTVTTTAKPSPAPRQTTIVKQAPTNDATLCQNLQTLVAKDTSALSEAQAQLSSVQINSESEQQRASDQLTQAQSLQQTVLGQSGTGTTPVAVTVAQAKSQLAASQAQVAKDEQALKNATIVAPADGTVADTAGAVGEQVSSDGVHLYAGPPGPSGSSSNQQQGFQLFAGQPTTGGDGRATQPNGYQPLITLYSAPMTVTAQVPEASIGQVHSGKPVTLTVTAAGATVKGTIDKVILDPARVSDGVYYDVVVAMADTPPGVLCGMTVTVGLTS